MKPLAPRPREIDHAINVEAGSRQLLRALWWRHPGILADFSVRRVGTVERPL